MTSGFNSIRVWQELDRWAVEGFCRFTNEHWQTPEWFKSEAEAKKFAQELGEAAKKQLPPKVAKKLTDRPPANRPPKAKD